MNIRLIGVLLPALLFGGAACTVDDIGEGKACDLDKPLNQQCIQGYVCKCESASRDTCFCYAEGQQLGLTAAPLSAPPPATKMTRRPSVDPSVRFLERRMRLELP